MSYTANTPQANQQVSQTQSLILANFQSLQPFSEGIARFGIITAPGPVASTYQVYQDSGGLKMQKPTGTAFDIGTSHGGAGSGYSYLPSGLLIQWGKTGNLPAGSSGAISFLIPFPTNVYNVQVTGQANNSSTGGDPNGAYYAYNFTVNSFYIWTTTRNGGSLSATAEAYWVAIGN